MSTEFPANPKRVDPYKNFKFKVIWDGKVVAAVSKVGALTRTTQTVKYREGGEPSLQHISPGQTEYSAITLERGVTHDMAFEQWANKVWDLHHGAGKEVSLADFRKDIMIELHNEAGQKVMAYHVYRAWVSEYTAMPELDAMGDAIAIQSIKLENEGWKRDTSVKGPKEPSFVDPSS